jgi:acetyl-CoA carboxylase, biotin carboxylase subunit
MELKSDSPKLFKKVLIANRGEIALRVIRACKELGISTVAVYSTADESSLHVKLADEAVCIGPPPSKQSYLNMAAILSAADITHADAIHPGYGFLSENAEFARLCEECHVHFIGPTPANIHAMGEKTRARKIAKEAGLPLLPGTIDPVPNLERAIIEADRIGYPVIIKAASGGGGKGIQVVRKEIELTEVFDRMRMEAQASFGDGSLYIEKFCERPRHVEIQVACDRYGKKVSLGERDCSIQRRHQKLIEECPSVAVGPELRKKMGAAALDLCRAVDYQNVGTVEFLLDTDQSFYFMEMNTRIQVEHPVTEMVTGIDLVKEQIKLAAGFPLSFTQEKIRWQGHAIECRINAEDSVRFKPSPGLITGFHLPGGFGVRNDTFIYDRYRVVPNYDSMIGKLIVHAPTRAEAIAKMRRALDETLIDGISTNVALHRKIFGTERFIAGDFDTHFLEEISLKDD